MQKTLLFLLSLVLFNATQAQENRIPKKIKTVMDANRPADHFMVQLSSDHLTAMPDSISKNQSGFSRGLNIYIMKDKVFKNSPKFSFGIGLGIGSSNIFFKNLNVDIKSNSAKLPFTNVAAANHFKKYKLSLSYLELPLEFRYSSNPANANKSWKFAIGGKVGTLINAHTKGKTLLNNNNQSINNYIQKENSKRFFNTTRFSGTARFGYGVFSLFGAYQLNSVLKDGAGAPMKAYQVGITLSGL